MAGYTVLIGSLQIIEEKETASLFKYRQELTQLRKEFRAVDMLDVKFFLFGMGNRTKLLYKKGKLINSITGNIVAEWQVRNETIIPYDYRVNIETISDVTVSIIENEQGIFINERGKQTVITGTETPVVFPSFEQYKYSEILKVLHNEILVNIVDTKPFANYFTYRNPWRRDAAIMALCLNKTKNIGLLKKWILSIDDPYDRNNAGEMEADKLAKTLYFLSFFTNKNNPFVKYIFAEISKYEVTDTNGKYI